MRQLVFGLVLVFGCSAFAEMAPVADRVAKQNALFEEYYQASLKNFPERATAYGDYRYNAQLAQVSLEEIARQHAEADDFLARLKAIPTDGMSDKDLLSHRILEKRVLLRHPIRNRDRFCKSRTQERKSQCKNQLSHNWWTLAEGCDHARRDSFDVRQGESPHTGGQAVYRRI